MYEKECLDSQKQWKFDKHSFTPLATSVEDDVEKICNVPFYLSGLRQRGNTTHERPVRNPEELIC